MIFKNFTAEQKDIWNEAVERSEQRTVFHTWEWLEFLERYQGVKVNRLGIYRKDHLVGLLPLVVKCMGYLRLAGSPLYLHGTPYLGVLMLKEADHLGVYESLANYLKEIGINFCRIVMPHKIGMVPARCVAFRAIPKHTHIIDLTNSLDDIWNGMQSSRRRVIRKAEKSNMSIINVQDTSYIDQYFEIEQKQYTRQGLPVPYKKTFYFDILESFSKDSRVTMTLALLGSNVVAGAVTLRDKNTMYYLDGVSDKEFNSISPNSLLQWSIIKLAKSQGFARYDLVGSDLPWLARYKAGFGADLMEYTCLEFARPRFVFALRDLYRRVRYRMPGILDQSVTSLC